MGRGEPICMKRVIPRRSIFCVGLKRENSEIKMTFYGMTTQQLASFQCPIMEREKA